MASEPNKDRAAGAAGVAVWACVVTGLFGWVAALFNLLGGQGAMAGLPLVASALAFGLLANAAFRR